MSKLVKGLVLGAVAGGAIGALRLVRRAAGESPPQREHEGLDLEPAGDGHGVKVVVPFEVAAGALGGAVLGLWLDRRDGRGRRQVTKARKQATSELRATRRHAVAAAVAAGELVRPALAGLSDRARPAAEDALGMVRPLAEQAVDRARPALERARPLVREATERVRPLALEALDRARPLVRDAAQRTREATHRARLRVGLLAA